MNILFLTLLDFDGIDERGIYTDLMREFVRKGHQVSIISPSERRKNRPTELKYSDGCKILKLRIGNVQKTNVIEKGLSTVLLENQFINGIKKYFDSEKFDLVLYSTPPITLVKAIEYIKNRDNAISYLMLKDIFPQNALDLGMLKSSGWKGIIYQHFRKKEIKLYEVSDYIGCMSEANVSFVLENNSMVNPSKVEVCPNTIELYTRLPIERNDILRQYGLPEDKVIFVYGGNLGKPQCIPYIISCIEASQVIDDAYFLIVGSGTEYEKMEKYSLSQKCTNMSLMSAMDRQQYEELLSACDVGLIFLDDRFTIPNFPSRLLSYLDAGLPVLASTDINTDLGEKIVDGKFGCWNRSDSFETFVINVQRLMDEDVRKEMGIRSRAYLEDNYSVEVSYNAILEKVEKR